MLPQFGDTAGKFNLLEIMRTSRCDLLPPPRRLCNRRCLFVCLSVCPLATLRKIFRMALYEIFREGWQTANEQNNDFRGDPDHGSGSVSRHW